MWEWGFRVSEFLSLRVSGLGFMVWIQGSGFRAYLDPTEPTFLGLLIMNSLYKSLKR